MPTYHLQPEGFKAIRRQLIWRTVFTVLFSMGLCMFLLWYQSKGEVDFLLVAPYALPILIAAVGLGAWRGMQKNRNNWDTYELNLTDDGQLTRSQGLHPTITYDLNQNLSSINENKRDVLVLRFKSPDLMMVIPKTIENRDDLIERLGHYADIGRKDEYGDMVRMSWGLAILSLVAGGILYMSTDKWVVGISGALLVIYLLWVFVLRQRNPTADTADKRRSFVYLALMAMVGYKLWLVFG